MDVANIVGLASGLLAIFTFLTGITSARELAQLRTGRTRALSPHRQSRLWLLLAISIPLFAISMVITLTQGLAGSDTGGAQFLLLLAGAILLFVYGRWLQKRWSWLAFLLACVGVLGVLGFVFGAISRGEEAESTAAGVLIGTGVGLLGLAMHRRTTLAPTQSAFGPGDATSTRQLAHEREILRYAQAVGGDVTVAAVALHTSLSLDQAQDVLKRLVARGFCQRFTAPSGAVTYRFTDFRLP